jgi:lipid A 3-O-deacylase PagL
MVRRQFPVALAVALLTSGVAYGQAPASSPFFTRVGFTPAHVFATNPFATGDAAAANREVRTVPSLTVEIGRQTDGSREWHHLYGLPAYGFGVSVAQLGSGVSRPVDAYTFFSWPFAHLNDHVQLTTDIGMGVSWNWKAFNQRTNSYASVLGSNMNARIDWGFYVRYVATPQTSLYAGVDFTHRSNGGMRQPDQGINVIGPSVGLRYNLTPERAVRPSDDAPAFRPSTEFIVGVLGGRKNVLDEVNYLHDDFGAVNITTGLQRQFYRYGKVAVGTDLIYDGSSDARGDALNASLVRQGAFGHRLAVGVYGGYEHVIGRFGAIVQAGYKVFNGSENPNAPSLYERYGWRFRFNDRMWGTFAVRAVASRKADALEFGLGYSTGPR